MATVDPDKEVVDLPTAAQSESDDDLDEGEAEVDGEGGTGTRASRAAGESGGEEVGLQDHEEPDTDLEPEPGPATFSDGSDEESKVSITALINIFDHEMDLPH